MLIYKHWLEPENPLVHPSSTSVPHSDEEDGLRASDKEFYFSYIHLRVALRVRT